MKPGSDKDVTSKANDQMVKSRMFKETLILKGMMSPTTDAHELSELPRKRILDKEVFSILSGTQTHSFKSVRYTSMHSTKDGKLHSSRNSVSHSQHHNQIHYKESVKISK